MVADRSSRTTTPHGGGVPARRTPPVGTACAQIYAQTWGSVYDTINYTTTGTLGDWFDSTRRASDADGIDNEMSFSHLDRNIAFEPHGEQLHVAGNKAIIYSHIADMLRPPGDGVLDAPGAERLRAEHAPDARASSRSSPGAPAGHVAAGRHRRRAAAGRADPEAGGIVLDVRGRARTPTPSTAACASTSARRTCRASAPASSTLQVQCQRLRRPRRRRRRTTSGSRSPRTTTSPPSTLQAGADRRGQPARRPSRRTARRSSGARSSAPPGGVPTLQRRLHAPGPATSDGNTGGDEPPCLARLRRGEHGLLHRPEPGRRRPTTTSSTRSTRAKVIAGEQSLDRLRHARAGRRRAAGLHGPLRGRGGADRRRRPPTSRSRRRADDARPGPGARLRRSADATDEYAFTIGAERRQQVGDDPRSSGPTPTNDYDLYLYRVEDGDGSLTRRDSTASAPAPTSEQIDVPSPRPGDYVIVGRQLRRAGRADPCDGHGRRSRPSRRRRGDAGAYTAAQKDAWIAKLRDVGAGRRQPRPHRRGAARAAGADQRSRRGDQRAQTVYVGQTVVPGLRHVRRRRHVRDEGDARRPAREERRPARRALQHRACGARRSSRRRSASRSRTRTAATRRSRVQFDVDQRGVRGGRRPGRSAASADAGARDAPAVPDRVDARRDRRSARARSAIARRAAAAAERGVRPPARARAVRGHLHGLHPVLQPRRLPVRAQVAAGAAERAGAARPGSRSASARSLKTPLLGEQEHAQGPPGAGADPQDRASSGSRTSRCSTGAPGAGRTGPTRSSARG